MAIAELIMPKLGESIMEATILKWHKNVGDHVKLDETVLDIATDKVDSEVPSTAEGVITEILFNVNDVVPIGTVIARLNTVESAATVAPAVPAQPEPAPAPVAETLVQAAAPIAPPPPAPVVEPEAIPYAPATPAVELMAKPAANRFYSPLVLNIANSEGVGLSELERIPGTGSDGRVSKKDILQYVADKKAGRIPAIQQPAQQPVYAPAPQPVQQAAAPVAAPAPAVTPTQVQPVAETRPAPVAPVERFAAPAVPSPVAEVPVQVPTPAPVSEAPLFAAPVSTAVTASQQAAFIPAQSSGKFSDPASVVVKGETEIIEMDRMRKLIAKHMVDSKHTSPHVTSFTEADVTNMVLWREKVKREFEQREGTKLTFTPMFLECIAKVIRRFPLINCSLNGDQIIIKKDINIGMATALSTGNLIVPVIKGADQLNIVGLSKAVNGLADAARNSRLKPEDTTGGTFTLTNVGTFGSLMGTPIISQPQVAIMAVGAIKKRAVVIESPEGDTIGIRHMMYLSLSYDHRIVDGSIGASFLTAVGKELEQWDVNKQWFHYL